MGISLEWLELLRAQMLVYEEENHLQEVHGFGLRTAVLCCYPRGHIVLTDLVCKEVEMLIGATSLS